MVALTANASVILYFCLMATLRKQTLQKAPNVNMHCTLLTFPKIEAIQEIIRDHILK